MNDMHKTCASHTDLKPRFVLVVHLCITCKCSVFRHFVAKELSIFRCSAVFLQLEHEGIVSDTGDAFINKLKKH